MWIFNAVLRADVMSNLSKEVQLSSLLAQASTANIKSETTEATDRWKEYMNDCRTERGMERYDYMLYILTQRPLNEGAAIQ